MKYRALLLLLLWGHTLPATGTANEVRPRGLFVSVIQKPVVFSDRKAIMDLVKFAKASRVRTLFVQVYYANQAWFLSMVGDSEPYETCLSKIGEDPFALLIRTAHEADIEVHAWLNMLSLNKNQSAPFLKKYGPGILTRDSAAKKSLEDYKIDNQYFLEPGDPRVHKELRALVREILSSYPEVDGLQFDYIRYPDTHPIYGHNGQNLARFKAAAGTLTIDDNAPAWHEWKRAQVTELVTMLAAEARAIRPSIKVSTTGCMPYARAYHEAFQDWLSWINRGLVDFVTIMDYSPDPAQFERWIKVIKTKTRDFSKVNIGIGAYKLMNRPEIFEKEHGICETSAGGACVTFHYGNLLENPALQRPLLAAGASDRP